jgi:hypothetical protein
LTLAADVYADPGQLQDVEYILHVPNGVTVQSVTYDPQYASIEKVTVVSDAQGSRYWATTEADVSSGWAFVQTTGTRLNGTLAKGVGITGWPIFLNL